MRKIPNELRSQKTNASRSLPVTVLDFYLKFVPDIHFRAQDTDTKFQTVSQKNQGVTSD
jgi:hypothetical protein